MKEKKISIVIPIWIIDQDLYDLTQKCLDTLKRLTKYENEIILIDNNSPLPVDKLAKQADIYIRNEENMGNGWAWSQGAKAATGEYLLFSDNDIEFSENWYQPLIKQLENDSTTGIVFPETWNYRDEPYYGAKLSGFFWMLKKKTFDEIGDFDPFYNPANFEDSDYFKRAQLAGYNLVCVTASKIKHFSRASCDKNKEVSNIYQRNESYYFNKYGILPFLDLVI